MLFDTTVDTALSDYNKRWGDNQTDCKDKFKFTVVWAAQLGTPAFPNYRAFLRRKREYKFQKYLNSTTFIIQIIWWKINFIIIAQKLLDLDTLV